MPWKIKQGASGCRGYAVVKEDSNELVGCHDSETKAKAQMRALYASEVEKANPCWDGYEMVGWKNKGGKKVPNCVPKSTKKLFTFARRKNG